MSKRKYKGSFLGSTIQPNINPLSRGTSPFVRGTGSKSENIEPSVTSLQPGQSVVPGSIDVSQRAGTWSANNPENVWWSQYEGRNTLDWITALLNNSNNGNSLSQGYADVVKTILQQLQTNPNAAISPDMIQALFTNLLSYQTTQEQRGYDYMMLNESRQYNNPTNELARLMGAGVSRDAAIQILSGSAGGQGFGSSGGAAVQGPVAGAGAAALNSSSAHQNFVNNIYNGINMVAGLLNQGVSMAESIEQIKGMHMQNIMTQNQLDAYNSVNEVTQFLHNLRTQGVLEQSTLDSFKNAEDVFKWILDNKDDESVAPLLQSGAFRNSFGSTIGRQMFNNHWQEQNRSRTDGEILDAFIRGQQLQNEVTALQPSAIGAEIENLTFQNLNLDAQRQAFLQNIAESSARIKLMDFQGKLLDWQAQSAELDFQLNSAGFPMLKQNRIDMLTLQAQRFNALFSRQGYNLMIKGADGKEYSPLQADILGWLRQGTNAADAAYLQMLYNGAVGSFATKYPNLYRLATCFDHFGIFQSIYTELNQNARTTQTNLMNAIPDISF